MKMEERFTEKIDKLIKDRREIEAVKFEWLKQILQPSHTLKQGHRGKGNKHQGKREGGEKKDLMQTIMLHRARAFIKDVINKKLKTKAM